jgi:hypothetical protein
MSSPAADDDGCAREVVAGVGADVPFLAFARLPRSASTSIHTSIGSDLSCSIAASSASDFDAYGFGLLSVIDVGLRAAFG